MGEEQRAVVVRRGRSWAEADQFAAMNSDDTAPKGETYQTTLIRVQTDQGVGGVGAAAGAGYGWCLAVSAGYAAGRLGLVSQDAVK